MTGSNEFHAIISTMRSGSSLCGHLLAEAGWIRYAGETHIPLHNQSGLDKARAAVVKLGRGSNENAPPCDKVLVPSLLPDGGKFLAMHADRIYLLLRHPLAIWNSGKPLNWSFFQLDDLATQLARVRKFVEFTERDKITVLSYYDLVDPSKRQSILGKPIEHYALNPQSGQAGWGDPNKLIRSGKIRKTTLEEDLRNALRRVWMDVENRAFLSAMNEYRAILKLVGRPDLDIEFPIEILDEVKTLRIQEGNAPANDREVTISARDLVKVPILPIEDQMLEDIEANDIVHLFGPGKLKPVLKELFRVLGPGGRIQISGLDLDKILSLGPQWRSFIRKACPSSSSTENHAGHETVLMNAFFNQSGSQFFYDFSLLKELLEEVGFREIYRRQSEGSDSQSVSRDHCHFALEAFR